VAEELLRDPDVDIPSAVATKLVAVPLTRQPVEQVDINSLKFDMSPRENAEDQGHLNALIDLFPRLPPIIVHASSMQVIDGVYRVLAARALDMPTIRAVLFHGTEADAFVHAVQCNVAHGKPLSLREREAAASTLLGHGIDWSDRRVAEVCGLSPTTVGRIRNLRGNVRPQSSRIGRDGRARPVDPVELRQRIAETISAFPAASTREIASRSGASQGTVRDVRERLRDGRSVARALEPTHPPAGDNRTSTVVADMALTASEDGSEFTRWFESHLVRDDTDWMPYIGAVPKSRVYEIADAARRCGESWQRLATSMEAQARNR
jgi:hypothetical protein